MKKNFLFIAVTSLLLSCGSGKEEKSVNEPIGVKTITVASADGLMGKIYSGTIEAGRTAELSFTGGGTLVRIPVETGAYVRRGQPIAEVDKQIANNELKTALVEEAKARDSYNRNKNMYDTKSLPESQWVEVQNALRQAEIQVNTARRQVKDCTLSAPFDGYIISKSAQHGQNVSAGMTVATLADISTVKVCFNIPSTDLGTFHNGQSIQVIVPELSNRSFTAKVIEKGIEGDQFTRTYTVKALINNPDGILLPGMICRLHGTSVFSSNEGVSNIVVIPEHYIQIDFDNNHFVWLVKNGKAQRCPVTLGAVTSKGIIIEKGIIPGDTIISEGCQKVYEGSNVKML